MSALVIAASASVPAAATPGRPTEHGARGEDSSASTTRVNDQAGPGTAGGGRSTRLDVHGFRVVKDHSGPVDYYQVIDEKDPRDSFIHASYRPGLETVTLGYEVPEQMRHGVKLLRWTWRAVALPVGGNDCVDGKADSAAAVYVSFKRGLKWYTLKYVWAATGRPGQSCMQQDNIFVAQKALVLEAGGPANAWRTETVDIEADFRRAFEGGNANAEVPPFAGVGLMSDGDQTGSFSAADYKDFVVTQ